MTKKSRKKIKSVKSISVKRISLTIVIVMVLVVLSLFIFVDSVPIFNPDRAYNELIKQVEFGPRVPGSEAHENARRYLVSELNKYADIVSEQPFDFADRHDSAKIYKGVNIVASFNVSKDVRKRILLAAHWDSRPWADNDPDSTNRILPVPGANDGASGVAVLLEMAKLFNEKPPGVGVDIVLFDLEDIGDETNGVTNKDANPFAIGSYMFVKSNPGYRPEYGILLDMVGDINLRIPKEGNSLKYCKPVVDKIWAAAKEAGSSVFVDEPGVAVMDDHIAFLQRGIKVVNLIHAPFPEYWHTIEDTPDKCSAESLKQVGDVLVEVIYSEK